MKLNPDLIRAILFTAEEETGFTNKFWFKENDPNSKRWEEFSLIKDYPCKEVYYHINQCEASGYFMRPSNKPTTEKGAMFFLDGSGFIVYDLSPKGHEFIANIRNDNNWSKVKSVANKAGSFALSVLGEIAKKIVMENINA